MSLLKVNGETDLVLIHACALLVKFVLFISKRVQSPWLVSVLVINTEHLDDLTGFLGYPAYHRKTEDGRKRDGEIQ